MAIDLAPTPAKEFVVRTLGNYDKPVLVAAIGLVLAVVAGVLGLLAWRHRTLALVGIGALGVVGAAATAYRLGFAACVPSLVSAVVGVATLAWLTRKPAREPRRATGSLSRRGLLAGCRRDRRRRGRLRNGRNPARAGRPIGPADLRPAYPSSRRPSRSRPARRSPA